MIKVTYLDMPKCRFSLQNITNNYNSFQICLLLVMPYCEFDIRNVLGLKNVTWLTFIVNSDALL
jgi:hypothetical protein